MNDLSTARPYTKDHPSPSKWRTALIAAATALLLWILGRAFGGAAAFYHAARAARGSWLAASFGLATLCVLIGALRWQLVLRGMGYALPYRRTLEVLLAVWPFVVVTPSRANEFLRALGVRNEVPLGAATSSVVAEKAIDLFVLLVLAALGAAMNRFWALAALMIGGVFLELLLVGAILVPQSRIRLFGARFVEGDIAFRSVGALVRAPAAFIPICAVSIAIRVLTIAVIHALLSAIGADVPLVATMTLWPLAVVAGLAPVTTAGMGTRDGAFIYLVERSGTHVDGATLLVATMGYSVVAIWSFALIGLPFMWRESIHQRWTQP